MFKWLQPVRTWFRKTKIESTDPESLVRESWHTDFSPKDRRFIEESDPGYAFSFQPSAGELRARKSHVFAWAENPLFRYDDQIVKGSFSWDEGSHRYSAGLLIRKNEDANFYSFLVSRDGRFRFDLFFNGNPMELVPWTVLADPLGPETILEVLAFGSIFHLFVDGRWVAEAENDTIALGKTALAVQNYGQSEEAVVSWRRFSIESRPGEVEKRFSSWKKDQQDLKIRRRILARSFQARGQFAPAVIQWNRVLMGEDGDPEDRLALAQAYLALGLGDEARNLLLKIVETIPGNRDVHLALANACGLLRDFEALEAAARRGLDRFSGDPWLLGLRAQGLMMLGRRDESAEASVEAATRAREEGLTRGHFSLDAAETLYRLNRRDEALFWAERAAVDAFGLQDTDQFHRALSLVTSLAPEHRLAEELRGLGAFIDGDLSGAEKVLRPIVEKSDNGAVFCVWAMILRGRNDRDEALAWFLKAAEASPETALFHLRAAEERAYRREWDLAQESLLRAETLGGSDGWTWNLRGQMALAQNRGEEALEALDRAYDLTGDEEVLVSLSGALELLGEYDEAETRLAEAPESGVLWNRRGNLASLRGDYDRAIRCYRRALALDPKNPVYMENLAGAWIETDGFSYAEELLVQLLDREPTVSVYNKVGNLARLMGQFARARAAYEAALDLVPGDPGVTVNLSRLYFQRLDYVRAREILDGASDQEHPGVIDLREKIRQAVEMDLQCDTCGRIWRVPKAVEPQGVLRLHGAPPDESPAGRCPVCGKVYCIGCAKENLRNNRFVCVHCDETLKLMDDHLKYLVRSFVEASG